MVSSPGAGRRLTGFQVNNGERRVPSPPGGTLEAKFTRPVSSASSSRPHRRVEGHGHTYREGPSTPRFCQPASPIADAGSSSGAESCAWRCRGRRIPGHALAGTLRRFSPSLQGRARGELMRSSRAVWSSSRASVRVLLGDGVNERRGSGTGRFGLPAQAAETSRSSGELWMVSRREG